ncbi:MAG TPA: MFS transporter [Dehalococcoidia bacterium]|nr:MFS transporter [Dehalococcoidia bacterium]
MVAVVKTESRNRFVIGALQYPAYRRYWLSGFASILGENVRLIAHFWLAWELTKSNLFLGLLGLASGVPAVLMTLIAGQVADRTDRRYLLMVIQLMTGALMLALGLLVATDVVARWHVLAIAAALGTISSFFVVSRSSLMPRLVGSADLPSAVAFDISTFQASRVIAPPIAAGLIAIGVEYAFFFIAAANVVACVVLIPLQIERTVLDASNRGLNAFSAGFSYIKGNSIFASITTVSVCLGFFGLGFAIILPSFADDVFDVGSVGFAAMSLTFGVGSLIGALLMATLRDLAHKGQLLFVGIFAFCGLLMAFGLSPLFPISLVLLLFLGLAYAFYSIMATSEIQMRVPDELRGRVMSIYSLTWLLIPLGGFASGAIASATSPQASVAILGATLLAISLGVFAVSSEARKI